MATDKDPEHYRIWNSDQPEGFSWEVYIAPINSRHHELESQTWRVVTMGCALVATPKLFVGFPLYLRTTQVPTPSDQTSRPQRGLAAPTSSDLQSFAAHLHMASSTKSKSRVYQAMMRQLLDAAPLQDKEQAIQQIADKVQHITSQLQAVEQSGVSEQDTMASLQKHFPQIAQAAAV